MGNSTDLGTQLKSWEERRSSRGMQAGPSSFPDAAVRGMTNSASSSYTHPTNIYAYQNLIPSQQAHSKTSISPSITPESYTRTAELNASVWPGESDEVSNISDDNELATYRKPVYDEHNDRRSLGITDTSPDSPTMSSRSSPARTLSREVADFSGGKPSSPDGAVGPTGTATAHEVNLLPPPHMGDLLTAIDPSTSGISVAEVASPSYCLPRSKPHLHDGPVSTASLTSLRKPQTATPDQSAEPPLWLPVEPQVELQPRFFQELRRSQSLMSSITEESIDQPEGSEELSWRRGSYVTRSNTKTAGIFTTSAGQPYINTEVMPTSSDPGGIPAGTAFDTRVRGRYPHELATRAPPTEAVSLALDSDADQNRSYQTPRISEHPAFRHDATGFIATQCPTSDLSVPRREVYSRFTDNPSKMSHPVQQISVREVNRTSSGSPLQVSNVPSSQNEEAAHSISGEVEPAGQTSKPSAPNGISDDSPTRHRRMSFCGRLHRGTRDAGTFQSTRNGPEKGAGYTSRTPGQSYPREGWDSEQTCRPDTHLQPSNKQQKQNLVLVNEVGSVPRKNRRFSDLMVSVRKPYVEDCD